MKVVICGDTHIGAVYGLGGPNGNGGNTRVDDYERTLNHIVDYCIENKADVFIQTGDAFDERDPRPEHLNVFNKALKRLSYAGITSIVMMGNHDYKRSGNSYTSAISTLAAKDYPNVRLVIEPQVIEVENDYGEKVQTLLMPYRDRKMYEGETTEEDSILYEQHVSSLQDLCSEDIPTIAVGHNFFYSGSYNEYSGLEVLAKAEAFDRCDVVVMGHYHDFKIIRKKNPIAFYVGSMEKINFGDEESDKFFIDYDTEKKKVKVLKCPSRQICDIHTDMSMYDAETLIKAFKEELKGLDIRDKIVRYKLSLKDKVMSSIKKKDIEKELYENGAFYVSKVILEPVFERLVRDESILEKKDDFSMVKAFVENQGYSKEMQDLILNEVRSIVP